VRGGTDGKLGARGLRATLALIGTLLAQPKRSKRGLQQLLEHRLRLLTNLDLQTLADEALACARPRRLVSNSAPPPSGSDLENKAHTWILRGRPGKALAELQKSAPAQVDSELLDLLQDMNPESTQTDDWHIPCERYAPSEHQVREALPAAT